MRPADDPVSAILDGTTMIVRRAAPPRTYLGCFWALAKVPNYAKPSPAR